MKNANHIVWADLIRVVAILIVICIHCSDPFNVSPEARLNPEYNLWGSIYGAFLRRSEEHTSELQSHLGIV